MRLQRQALGTTHKLKQVPAQLWEAPSGCTPTSPGGEQLGPGREQLLVSVPAVRESVHSSTVCKAFPSTVYKALLGLYIISGGL